MSSEDFVRVRALYSKARELHWKGHLLRAAEIYGRAAEAARALDAGADNLTALEMQWNEADCLLAHIAAVDVATVDPVVVAAHRAKCVTLLSAVVAALERRRVAGTLLEGKCTASEEAWSAAVWRDDNYPPSLVSGLSKLVGYAAFLEVVNPILGMFENAWYFKTECSAAQFQSFTEHVVHAADLMQLPRGNETTPLLVEVSVAQRLSAAVADDSGGPHLMRRGLEVRLVLLLTGACVRLLQSGVLQARDALDERLRLLIAAGHEESAAAVDAAKVAPGLRSCALAGCGAKEAHPQHFKRCSACKGVVYCSKEHQLEGWPSHKKPCKAACKAAAASSDGDNAGPGAAGARA